MKNFIRLATAAMVVITCAMLTFLWDLGLMSMGASTILNVSIGAVAIFELVILCVGYYVEHIPEDRPSRLFFYLLLLAFAGIITDNFSRGLENIEALAGLNRCMTAISYLVGAVSAPIFFLYQENVFAVRRQYSFLARWVQYAMVADLAFLLVGFYMGWIFTIDDKGVFRVGFGHTLSVIYPMGVYFLSFCVNLMTPMKLRQRLALISFSLTPLAALVMAYFSDFALLYVSAALALLMMHSALQVERGLKLSEQTILIAEQNNALLKNQTHIMMSQMQPHFIYNTLNSIHYLCGVDSVLAQETITDFSHYLRTNMEALDGDPLVSFQKELEHTETYLNIELLRFADILNVEYDIQYTDFQLPALTLQPIVENAVKYGVRSRAEGGTVFISSCKEGDEIVVTVRDDGLGFDPTAAPKDGRKHLGIANTRRRLEIICDGKLEIASSPGAGTTVRIILQDKR